VIAYICAKKASHSSPFAAFALSHRILHVVSRLLDRVHYLSSALTNSLIATMVSLTISISSEGLSASLHPTPSASIYSSRSHCSAPPPYQKHHPYRYGFKARTSRKGSFESLLPRSKKERKGKMVGSGNATSERKGSETLPITIEMRKSFGRGGAGNIRMLPPVLVFFLLYFPYSPSMATLYVDLSVQDIFKQSDL
jgi:hypothetical protein